MTLAALASVDRTAFGWLRTGERPLEYTLSSGDRPVAILRWPASGSSPVTVQTADAEWTLERSGFLRPRIAARAGGSAKPFAEVTAHPYLHTIAVAGGPTLRLHRAGMLVPAWKVSTASGDDVVHIEPVADGRKLAAGAVVVTPSQADLPGLLALIVLGWYFVTLMWFEDETVEALAPLEGSGGPAGPRGSD
jgi:hypothetical protein